MSRPPIRVLFVCLGNICRSPLAEGVFRHHATAAGFAEHFEIASAGTGSWHVGEPPDPRMCMTAMERGVDLSRQRARTLRAGDLTRYDHIFAMDKENLKNTRALGREASLVEHVVLFREFDPEPESGEVPDPYYGGPEGFTRVFDIVDRTSRALLEHLRRVHAL